MEFQGRVFRRSDFIRRFHAVSGKGSQQQSIIISHRGCCLCSLRPSMSMYALIQKPICHMLANAHFTVIRRTLDSQTDRGHLFYAFYVPDQPGSVVFRHLVIPTSRRNEPSSSSFICGFVPAFIAEPEPSCYDEASNRLRLCSTHFASLARLNGTMSSWPVPPPS